ncbi:reverse transcriptase domain-containing protein [Tanacetum coccineum]|uniref:Reverse transcriptase domain-containing protein n=1 Tax=Tanacetum coccineum TaxID=301880 RepID=A0ABQ4WKY3_9ASTR
MVPIGLDNLSLTKFLRRNVRQIITNVFAAHRRKMQKEKEQKDKLNAVKARLIYGEESGIKIRSREESHYSESKTPTARTEPEEGTEIEVPGLRKSSECNENLRVYAWNNPPRFISVYMKEFRDLWTKCIEMTTSFLQGEVAALSHGQRKAPSSWKPTTSPKAPKKGTSGKDKPLAYTEDPTMERVAKSQIYQASLTEMAKVFPPMREEDVDRGPIDHRSRNGNILCLGYILVTTEHPQEVLYEHCFIKLRQRDKIKCSATTHLYRIHGEPFSHMCQIALAIKNRPGGGGTVTLQSSRVIPMECAMISGPSIQSPAVNQVLEEKINIAIHPEYPEQTVAIGSTLTEKGRKELCSLLKQNLDIFAWKPADMTGVPRNIAEHRLNIREGYSPVRQKKRGQAPERNKVIQEEVEKLVDAGIMKEVHYHSWLSNPVMVKKHDGTWRMCVDFKDLNNACPKDCYPLPEIDWKVESLCGYSFKCFLDAYKGYHQIKMAKEDEEKTTNIQNPSTDKHEIEPKEVHLRNAGRNVLRLQKLPTLTAPREHEELIIYLAAAKEAISAVLMTDREGRQIPVYFVSRTLRGPEVNYTPMEKLVLALLSASKRLKRYFQAHTIVVVTDQPIKQLLSSSEISGRMLKWKFELEGYDIQYRPRTAIKGQILADFIVERPEEESPDELMTEPEVLPEPWTLFTDGSSCIDGSGAGLILTNPEGTEFTYAMRFRFEATNNEAEYEALIAGLRIAEQMGVKNLQANVDSRLVANQVNGSYIAKESGMVQYLDKVKTLAKSFKEFSIKQIPRSENKKADALSKIASTSFAHLNKQVLVEELKEKSINEKEILDVVEEEGNTWMTPICEYLAKEILPEDKKKARAVRRKAARYAMINGTLYKKSFLGPWLRCVGPLQANYVLREIHEGSCSMHSGPRSVVAKVIRTGYYWPTMHMDARNLIRECNDCQIHRPIPRNPQQNLTPITSPWPFYKWGIDIAGPFPEGPGKVKFLIVAIDYFTKWIEAKAVATITGNQVKKFVWDNIVCRFGLPGEIISDNGKQFRDNPFKDWCEKLCIRQCFASVKHPQANGLVERANRSLGEGIKARLDERSKDWIEELPHVLWAHRTMIKSSNGETPFSLTYGTEAVIPAEIGMPTLRTAEIDPATNNEALEINLDLIEERREQAAIQEAKSKKKMEKYYNTRVRDTSFKPGDMVYRSNEASHARDEGKLGPKWEGPYEVKESLGKGAYKLKDCKGNEIPRTWNIEQRIKKSPRQQHLHQHALILGRPFLRTARALIDVHGEQMTLRHDDQSITFQVGDTKTFSYNTIESVIRVDVIDVACEEFAQEVLGFSNISKSGNPTPTLEPILSTFPTSLTPFGGGDFILEEIEACLTSESIPPGIDDADFNPKEDLLTLERLLNSDPTSTLPPEEPKFEELKTVEPSSDELPGLELKDLPPHLEYAFLERTDKLLIIIAKDLKDEDKSALLKVLRSHKHVIAWKILDIKGIDPKFYTHKILIEDNVKPTVQHQRRV